MVDILLLSLANVPFEPAGIRFQHLLNTTGATVMHARNANGAENIVSDCGSTLKVIILTDWELHRGNGQLFRVIKQWVQEGGTIIMGCFFHQDLAPDDFKSCMLMWQLPWTLGQVLLPRTYLFNAENILYRNKAHSYNHAYTLQSSRVITNIGQNNCLYFGPPPQGEEGETIITQNTMTPIAFTKVREGRLGCLANLPAEGALVNVVLRMCGL